MATAAREADGRVGVSGMLGRLMGRARAGKMGRGWQAGWAGWLARWGWLGREAEQAWATARLPPFFSFSVFLFFSFV